MKRKLITPSVLLLSLPAFGGAISELPDAGSLEASASSLSKIVFDGDNGTALAGEYGDTGVVFGGHNGGQAKLSTFVPLSPGFSIIGGNAVGSGGGGFEMQLPDGTNAFGIHVGGAQFTGNTVSFYDANDQLLAEIDVVDQNGPSTLGYSFVGLTSEDPISRVTVSTAGNDFVWYDDVMFGVVPVPEPSSLAVLGAAGLGMLIRRRRA